MNRYVKHSLLFSQIAFIALLPIWLKLTDYLHPLVIGVVWFCWTSLLLCTVLLITKETITIPRLVLNGVILLYSIGLLILLFFRPENQSYGSLTINLIPFQTIAYYFSGNVDFLIAFYNLGANIGLFIPFGSYYCFIKNKPSLGYLLTITIFTITFIEGLQYLTKRGSFDIDDFILNVAGVYVGYLIHPLFAKILVIKTKRHAN